MKDKLKTTFNKIQAEDVLKEKTANFLHAEIQKRSQAHRHPCMRFVITGISFVLLLLTAGSYNLYFTPSAYVDLDVNPSIELTLNRFGRVLEASPYNDDGAVALNDLNLRHTTYEEAVQKLLKAMIGQGYLKQDGLVSITVQTENTDTEKTLLNGLKAAVSSSLSSHHSAAATDIFAVSREVKECAHDYNLSPAKYIAITELQTVDPTATFEDCADHSISEIHQLAEEHRGNHHEKPYSQYEESQKDTSEPSNRDNSTPAAVDSSNENCEKENGEDH